MQDDVVRADYLGLQFPQVAMAFQDTVVVTNRQKYFCATLRGRGRWHVARYGESKPWTAVRVGPCGM